MIHLEDLEDAAYEHKRTKWTIMVLPRGEVYIPYFPSDLANKTWFYLINPN